MCTSSVWQNLFLESAGTKLQFTQLVDNWKLGITEGSNARSLKANHVYMNFKICKQGILILQVLHFLWLNFNAGIAILEEFYTMHWSRTDFKFVHKLKYYIVFLLLWVMQESAG